MVSTSIPAKLQLKKTVVTRFKKTTTGGKLTTIDTVTSIISGIF